MKISKFIILGVLLGLSFFGGVYTAARFTVDEEFINKVTKPLSDNYNLSLNGIILKSNADELDLLLRIKNGANLDEHINFQRKQLSENIKILEEELKSYPYEADNAIYLDEIERSKKILLQ